MKYSHIVKGTFLERPNRFIAYVDIEGKTEKVHVKNTGRCRELLTDHATVFLEKSENKERSTAYDLVAVLKNDRLINMDSQAPNKVVEEWLLKKVLFPDLVFVRPETVFGNSRFDFYLETSEDKVFMEVKGVTLERDGTVLFPDAPSERAVKHVEELIRAVQEGYRTYIMFVIQMKGVRLFRPNWEMHPAFAESLEKASEAGVRILAYDCQVGEDGLSVDSPVPVELPELSGMTDPLLEWYRGNRRILPWREEPTPYHVWVSEIMLQQTRVEAVKPYYDRFMRTLPTLGALAEAKEELLLKLWEGLGYYNRVRNMQKAAIRIRDEYHGEIPSEYEELVQLNGIGSYTAGAISSIAYGKKVPAVDGNVLRVTARLLEEEGEIGSTETKRKIRDKLRAVMPEKQPGDFNQAMMEIGATVCVPNGAPRCGECPLAFMCRAFRDGRVERYPKKSPKKGRRKEEKTVLVIQDENQVVLRKRPRTGLLSGMYEFPSMKGYRDSRQVLAYLKKMGLETVRITELKKATHIFSHVEWHMKGFLVRVDELEPKGERFEKEGWLFADTEQVKEKYPIPSALSAYAEAMHITIGSRKVKEDWRKNNETVIDSDSLL